jgi:hypothetical protein
MSVGEIMGEIAALPPAEQQVVIRFARKLDEEGPLSPSELGALAQRLAHCADDREAATLKQSITGGFYGGKRHA